MSVLVRLVCGYTMSRSYKTPHTVAAVMSSCRDQQLQRVDSVWLGLINARDHTVLLLGVMTQHQLCVDSWVDQVSKTSIDTFLLLHNY